MTKEETKEYNRKWYLKNKANSTLKERREVFEKANKKREAYRKEFYKKYYEDNKGKYPCNNYKDLPKKKKDKIKKYMKDYNERRADSSR